MEQKKPNKMGITDGTSIAGPEIEADRQISLEEDSRHQLVQRILATPDFVRSPQLSKFLLYICTAVLRDRSRNLSEQHIGVTVFGREPDFDSAADTIVRSHALRLRRRLEQYFQRTGRNEPIHLIIPRGSYVPVFLPAPERNAIGHGGDSLVADLSSSGILAEATEETPSASRGLIGDGFEGRNSVSELSAAAEHSHKAPAFTGAFWSGDSPVAVVAKRQTSVVWRYRFLTTFMVMLFVGLAIAFGMHLRTHFRIDRRHILWGRLFTEDQPTQIVLGDSGLVLFHAFTWRYVSLHDYLSNDYSKQMPFVEHIEPKYADFLLHRRYTSMVDATTLSHLLRLPEAIPERTLVHYSRDMHVEDFYSDNVIMIGAQEAVPWVELFEKNMNFVFSIDNSDNHSFFLNRQPRTGELAEYSSHTPATNAKVYGVIAFLPNLRGTGNVLILEGLSMVGTESAINLVIDDNKLLPVLEKIRRPDGSLPHFEMLLESDTLGEGAGPARIVAMHMHD